MSLKTLEDAWNSSVSYWLCVDSWVSGTGKKWARSGFTLRCISGEHVFYEVSPWERRSNTPPCAGPQRWATPMTRNRKSTKAMTPSTNNGRRTGGGNSSPPGLEQEVELSLGIIPKEMEPIMHHEKVQKYLQRYPTPNATDYKGVSTRSAGKERPECDDDLPTRVARMEWSTPRASDATKAGPNMKFGAGGTPLPAQVGGQLNPDWIEWLMGYPAGWTVCPLLPRRKPKRRAPQNVPA